MFHKVYFSRYRQAMERGISSRKPAKETSEDKSACPEESVPEKPGPDRLGAAEKQSNNMVREAAENPAGKNVLNGFREIAPGMYQFRQAASDGRGYEVPLKLLRPLLSEHIKPQKKGEFGFKRVDGLPGPYQHYSTPVFQFT